MPEPNPRCNEFEFFEHHDSDDEGLPVVLSDFVNRANIRVIKGRRGLGFPLEPSQCLGIFGYFIGQKLQRDEPMEVHVLKGTR